MTTMREGACRAPGRGMLPERTAAATRPERERGARSEIGPSLRVVEIAMRKGG